MTAWLVPDGLDGERVDAAASRMTGLTRSRVADLIDAGQVRLGGANVAKASQRVRAGDLLDVDLDEAARPPVRVQPRLADGLRIVHLDPDIVVVDKPAGVAAHPSLGWDGPDVLGHLAAAGIGVATTGADERQGIVQRLDVGTSGLMVVARAEGAYSVLKQAFRDRRVDKEYQALVQGRLDPPAGTIEAPIGRHPGADWKFAVVAGGRPSVTHYETLEAFAHASLLRVHLETGRTHQIRVHLSALHHPCAGDPLYGADPVLAARLGLERQWLHAVRLAFIHPGTGEPCEFASPPSPDLGHALDVLRH
ncbi:MAG: RluA family pseudouridine synthase [Actinomycetia bacterium]|nr:RluA family pseudouridine synthase [Actinomycetes bacterium]